MAARRTLLLAGAAAALEASRAAAQPAAALRFAGLAGSGISVMLANSARTPHQHKAGLR